ncbi:MAG: LacI family transcriptional regulator [Lentisphaerae bacterium]|jgi:LacI family transcriptional regulator|nr:LacI family transcriptional regulator [Lentisphaerota bacterium]
MESKPKEKNLLQIAKIAGVSLTTASRAFTDHPYVKESTKKRILDAAHQINYEPRIALSKRNVGVIFERVESIHKDFYLSIILSHIAREFTTKSLGFELIPMNNLERMKENFIKTAIAILYSDESIEQLRKYEATNIILINAAGKGFSSVCSDHVQGIELAYEHLRDLGHTHIALFMDHFEGWGCRERVNSFLSLQQRYLGLKDKKWLKNSSESTIENALNEVLSDGVTGIIVASESSVLRVMSEAGRMGVNVPEDISIVSFENEGVSRYLSPAQTTIAQDFESIVRHAVELAGQFINNKRTKSRNICLDNDLIIRHSTCPNK